MRPGADGVVRRRLPAAASGGFSRRSFRCPSGSRRAVQPSPAFVPRAMRSGASAIVRRRLPVAASGGYSRRSFRCPGAAVRFSPPPHSSPAPCVPVRMGSCGAVCRLRLPADLPAAAHRCRTSSAERTSFGGPNPASAHFRLRACAFVASVRCDAGRLSAPDPSGARRCPSESLFPPDLPAAAPRTGAGAERLSDEFFAPPLRFACSGKLSNSASTKGLSGTCRTVSFASCSIV